jgi:hypothetical protein
MSYTTHYIKAAALEDRGYGTIINVIIKISDEKYTASYRLGISPEGDPARQEFQGPLISELFGWINAEPIMIALDPIIDYRPIYRMAIGDLIEIEGHGTLRLLPGCGYRPTPKVEVVR